MEHRYDSDGVSKVFIKNSYGKIRPNQIGLYATSGYGKSLAEEGLVEAYFNAGFICIYLGDGMKGEEEGAYAMFEPQEKYHLNILKQEGKEPRKVPVKLYHPFSFGLPNNKLPNYNIFTIPIKDLNRREFSMMAETQADSDTIRILMQTSQNLNKSAGIYQLLHDIQDLIKGKKYKETTSPSAKNFYLSVTSGTAKSMQDIANLFQPFKKDYFLVDENCKHNLNFKELLSDNKNMHFFSTKYLRDPKIKEFLILLILNKVLENKDYAKHPVVLIIPEIRKLCPDRAYGYQKYLSESIKEALSTMRNIGEGFASILSSQSWNDTSQEIRDSHSITFIGKLNLNDIDKISKIMGYNREMRGELAEPKYPNTWYFLGNESIGDYHLCLPSWGHAEPEYNFDKMFAKYYPDLMISNSELIEEMKDKLKQEEEKFKEKIKREEESERQRQKRKQEQKETKKAPDIDKIKEIKNAGKQKDIERAYNLRVEGLTLEKVGEMLGVGKDTVNRWVRKYKKGLAEKDPNKTP